VEDTWSALTAYSDKSISIFFLLCFHNSMIECFALNKDVASLNLAGSIIFRSSNGRTSHSE
jgi:hypothetical protein